MEIQVELAGGKKVIGKFHGHTVVTDQPVKAGGEDSAPAPFDLFLASLATCAGFFVQSFCQARGIPTDGITITQVSTRDPETHLLNHVGIRIGLPKSFPERYRAAVVAAVNGCSVKKALQSPPEMEVTTQENEA
jgi:putative redox protein